MVPLVIDSPTQCKVSGREALGKAERKVTLKCHPTSQGVQGVESGSFSYTLNLQPFVNSCIFSTYCWEQRCWSKQFRAKRHNFKSHRGNVPSTQWIDRDTS